VVIGGSNNAGAAQLTQQLNWLDIRPNRASRTTLFQLATEILARTLSIHSDDWAAYEAEISLRPRFEADSAVRFFARHFG
jgi:hypothetical protein